MGLFCRRKNIDEFFGSMRNRKIFVVALTVLLIGVAVSSKGLADNTVRLVRMEPGREVPTKSNLLFIFSSDVVPKSRVGKYMTSNQIKFVPEVPGKIQWETPSRLRFYPEVAFRPSTSYTVEIAKDLPGLLKKTFVGPNTLKFTTERFRIVEGNVNFIYNPSRRKGLLLQACVTFNFPVAKEDVQKNVLLTFADTGKPIKFTVRMANGGREAIITSGLLQREDSDRKINFKILPTLRCSGGSIGLKEGFEKTLDFHQKKALAVNDVTVDADNSPNAILIRFSEPPDPEAVADFITVKPAVKYRISVDGETVSLRGDGFKPGRRYEVLVAKGLPSLNGKPLTRDYRDAVTFPDLEPSVSFNAPGRYLSSRGNLNIGLETVNIAEVEVEIAKIYANNIAAYLHQLNGNGRVYSYQLDRFGKVLEQRKIAIANVENEFVTTPLNLREFLADKRRGIFQITVCDPEHRWRSSSKVVIVTDLGILAKFGEDEVVVWVNSLDTLAPKPGTRVSLVSYNNQELASGITDSLGLVRFSGLRRELKEFRSYLIVAENGDDFSFVNLKDGHISKTDFAVEGRPNLTEGYEAFLYTDRGVYRPGEEANLVAVVRGVNTSVPPEFPVRLTVTGPDGMVFREYLSNTKQEGICQFKLEFPDYARTGRYTAALYVAKEAIGNTAFNVEEFMPDRIKVETALDKESYQRGDTAKITVTGVNLFGPPATGRRVDVAVRLEGVPFSPPDYRSYTFGEPGKDFRVVEEVVGQGELDLQGRAEFAFNFPDTVNPSGMIRAIFQATVTEDGGRAVSSYKVAEFHPRRAYIGLRPRGEDYAKVGEVYTIDLVELDPEGKPLGDTELDVELYSVTWNSIYRRDSDGHYTYHSEREEEKIDTAKVVLTGGRGSYDHRPTDWGCYKLVFIDRKTGARSSYEFYASGWGYAPWAMDHPDRIELDTNKKSYHPGETAYVQIKAPFSGRALVTVEREKIYDMQVVELKENTGMVAIRVREHYKPNVYVSVHLIRNIKKLDKRAPARAFGTIPLTLDCSAKRLDLSIQAPEEMRPGRTLEVEVKGPAGGGSTYLTLAAVDEGILQLTDFKTPDLMDFFYGKRSLGIESYDLYGMLLPEVKPVQTSEGTGGDGEMEGVRRRNLNPISARRVKPVSLWSGLVKLDMKGRAKIKLDVPAFNGTLRLMAVGISGDSFGSATKKVLVREPVVLTSTFPRFVAPGDRFVIPVSVFNGTGGDGTVELKLMAKGPVTIDGHDQKKFTVANQKERVAHFAVVAGESAGKCQFILEGKLNGVTVTETTELAVRPPQPQTVKTFTGGIKAEEPLVLDLRQQWLAGTEHFAITLSPLPGLKYAGSLKYLLGYPYGCVEQTTSKIFPLLYFDDLAKATNPELFPEGKAEPFVNKGIEKLCAMQLRSGGFAYWPGTDWESVWGSIYAANFLVEARKAGYIVPDRTYDRMLDYLRQLARQRVDGKWELQRRVYALYVLSLAGDAQTSNLAYIKNQRLQDLTPDARAQLAAAYYYAGDRKSARELLPNTFAPADLRRETGGNFNSQVRTDAIILNVLADIDPDNPSVPKLVKRLTGQAKVGWWGTTQENAFAFMALGKIYKKQASANYTGVIAVDGKTIATFDSKGPKRVTDPRLGRGQVTVAIKGEGTCYYYAETAGVSLTPVPHVDNGIVVRREFFDRRGHRVDLNRVKQGDLLVARVMVKTAEDNVENVAIVDLLPTGLEIENPRLATSARVDWLDSDQFEPKYIDIRDDRILLFANFDEAGTKYFYYAVRAVSCGTFVVPPIKAECMYEPEVTSLASGGKMVIEK